MSKPTQSLMTSDVGTLWVGEGFPWFFKCPVVGPPCDLTRILVDDEKGYQVFMKAHLNIIIASR